ncbi:P-loop containing nucleoside triphosphate hydrolases superfamily protein [Actinidia rufa]|uniref:adenylate kinase n=1 Tax=Actinidia rufa TaxID=165716 RepID=A0A7J0FY75_9ERIC|nr:P-loop containing nucleoside triphosphate hydrolases superfamily protein [Actinidia rufa]
MIQNMIKEGKIVPSEVTIKLLQRAIQESGNDKFLIDGFPRNEENRAAFESVGREDDNIDTIRKRFKVFLESSLPVIEYYNSKGKVRKIDAAKPIEEVFEAVKAVFSPLHDKVKHRSSTPWSFSRYRDRWFLWRIKYGQELSRACRMGCSMS